MGIWWSLHLRREAASVPLARRLLLGAMETAGVDPDISFDLSVALTEACANAVEHGGYEGPGAASPSQGYCVTAFLDGERCRIEVTDSGPGFPAGRGRGAARRNLRAQPSAPSENGRGLGLIEQLSDHADFRNRPGRGAMVRFDKVLKWREDALLRAS
ncbi:ATP-binding protein [Streptomyces sp. NBC_01387]|uniref:ATP-binding protein n=1 Tax=unclassified Streptomyces TaxID=2593676 RepID=UPI0020259DDC|nr:MULTISPECIES: ATP-binding protein [unclassified Streptomyces]MCX4549473.1 ATP-binding protein [Streptomyces sp. NBC_01500]WSC21010.1 ATP-binding protein [Streptomyces sp. NBC_01766]WSV54996.1 ATP-binding protein [Streptomyces sp. NBC_01014]